MNASAQPLIKLDGIKKVFYTDEVETHALAGIHLEIQQGEYVAIAGPSGCGKSTLLAILGLLDTPTDVDLIVSTTVTGLAVDDLPTALAVGASCSINATFTPTVTGPIAASAVGDASKDYPFFASIVDLKARGYVAPAATPPAAIARLHAAVAAASSAIIRARVVRRTRTSS